MGTNYYARGKITKAQILEILEKHSDMEFLNGINNLIEDNEGLHIGKTSAGWTFSFQAHNTPHLKSFSEWMVFLKNSNITIYDEYGHIRTFSEFKEMVEELQQDNSLKNHAKMFKTEYPKQYFNDSLGYSFTIPEFF